MNKAILPMLSGLFLISLGARSVEANVVYHIVEDGPFASFSNFQGDNTYSFFNVTQGGNPSNPVTNMIYYSTTCDYLAGICEGITGSGQIPVQDFTANGKSATLTTNTASDPSFYAFKWTINYNTGVYTDSSISLGSINLTWKGSNLSSSQFIGISTSTVLNTTWKSVGRSTSSSATVSGTFSGNPVMWTSANIGTNFNNDFTMERQ